MSDLTGAQRKHLRGLAHGLDPVVHLGQQGLTDAVREEIDHALEVHELIKLRFVDFKDEKKQLTGEIAQDLDAHVAGTVGHVAILYRRHPDPEKRKIHLPS